MKYLGAWKFVHFWTNRNILPVLLCCSQNKEASPAPTTYIYEQNCGNCQAVTTTASHLRKKIDNMNKFMTTSVILFPEGNDMLWMDKWNTFKTQIWVANAGKTQKKCSVTAAIQWLVVMCLWISSTFWNEKKEMAFGKAYLLSCQGMKSVGYHCMCTNFNSLLTALLILF